MSELKSVDFEVFGKVQGVFFRKHTQQNALKLGLSGFVQNTSHGSVVGRMEGRPMAIKEMKEWLAMVGSPMSKIDEVKFSEERPLKKASFAGFEIKKYN